MQACGVFPCDMFMHTDPWFLMVSRKDIPDFIFLFLGLLSGISVSFGDDVVIVQDGSSRANIQISPKVMATDKDVTSVAPYPQYDQELQRRSLRESVKDLALYLGKMSGAKVSVLDRAPQGGGTHLPILIGDLAVKAFGPPEKKSPYKQGWRIVVSPKGIGLMGESDESTSYAIYEFLDRLGCRWYMPSDMGEVIPEMKTIRLPESDISGVPSSLCRHIWPTYTDEAFCRRNRTGGINFAGHALEISGYISKELFAAHPEWHGLIHGKRVDNRFCWASAEAASAVGDGIIAILDKNHAPTISLSPDDGAEFCECPKCIALDANDWDPSLGQMSITDRYIHFCNQIAERVSKKHPDVLFGFYAYVQYTRPPVRKKMHPNLVPIIAPITYCRAHSMADATCPSRPQIRTLLEGWAKAARMVGYYNYMFHLAEVAVPYPMITQMKEELPIIYGNKVKFWIPETLNNFESILPGMYLSIRMSWDANTKPSEIMDEFYSRFYGAAAAPMRRYWELFDDAWIKVPEHAGCGFGYPKRFTPDFMRQARTAMNEALAACKTEMEKRRVTMQDDAFKQFELFMKLRGDLFAGRLDNLDKDAGRYLETQLALGTEYQPQSAFAKKTTDTIAGNDFISFFKPAYTDGSRIAKNFKIISGPLGPWHYQVDKPKKGETLGWSKMGFDDKDWKTTDPSVDTWFSLGLETYYGPMWYRTKAKLPSIPDGKKVYLWVSSMDGNVKVFVNGQHIPYVNEKGEKNEEFKNGFCQAVSFDITAAIKSNAENQIAITATHLVMNELGTGGLIGPVLLYHEKP